MRFVTIFLLFIPIVIGDYNILYNNNVFLNLTLLFDGTPEEKRGKKALFVFYENVSFYDMKF